MNIQQELKEQALDSHEESKPSLIEAGKRIAIEIIKRDGRVTSTQVLDQLRLEGYDPDSVDKRFMGAVFRKGFLRIGYEPTGSHARPVSIWTTEV